MGLFDQFIVGPEVEQPAASSVPPPVAPPVQPGGFNQFIRGADEAAPVADAPTSERFSRDELNREFGSLKPYTPSWSEWVANKAQDAYAAMGADPYTSGKLGRGTRDVLGLTPAGPLMSGADVQHYAGQGEYGKAAISALGVLPAAPLATAAVRGGVNEAARLPLNFADSSLGEVARAAPSSAQQLKEGVQQFGEYRGSGQTYPVQDVAQFVSDAKKTLSASGKYAGSTGADAHTAFDELANKTKTQPYITAPDMDELRLALSGARGDPAAMQGRGLLYDYLKSTGDTTTERAVGNYGAGKRTGIVEQIVANAEMAKNPDVALANKLRSEVQKVNVRPRGFNEDEVAALDAARTAGSTREKLGNAALKYGVTPTALGAGGAATAAILGLVDPMIAAKTVLAPMAAGAVGGALKASGAAARRGAAQGAADLVAQRSPMYLEAQAASNANPLFQPGAPAQDFVMRNAIAQELLRQQQGEQ